MAMSVTPQDSAAWASVPWTPFRDGDNSDVIGWRKHDVPYMGPGSAPLQTLDIWIPASTDGTTTAPAGDVLPQLPGRWLIFIHGGAWRAPVVTASSFSPAATRLLHKLGSQGNGGSVPIAGLASLNYRLSPKIKSKTQTGTHPEHIADVLAGIAFLQRLGGATGDYALSGHSCGATLAFQAVMDPARWGLGPSRIVKPAVVVGLNGLYDLVGFIRDPPTGYEELREGYDEFTRGAFGDHEQVWKAVCPATAEGHWVAEWKEATEVVLVQSREDTLVPYSQLEALKARLEEEGGVQVRVEEAGADHDEMWERGDRMAEILWDAMEVLSAA